MGFLSNYNFRPHPLSCPVLWFVQLSKHERESLKNKSQNFILRKKLEETAGLTFIEIVSLMHKVKENASVLQQWPDLKNYFFELWALPSSNTIFWFYAEEKNKGG